METENDHYGIFFKNKTLAVHVVNLDNFKSKEGCNNLTFIGVRRGGRRGGPNVTLVKKMDPYEVEPMVANAKRVSLMATSKCHLGDLVLIES